MDNIKNYIYRGFDVTISHNTHKKNRAERKREIGRNKFGYFINESSFDLCRSLIIVCDDLGIKISGLDHISLSYSRVFNERIKLVF